MAKENRTCAVCGKLYSFCTRCDEDRNKPLWYFTFCSENCKDIYDTTSKYDDKRITLKQAHEKLNKLNLSRFKYFGDSYKKIINEIESDFNSNEVKQLPSFKEKKTDKKYCRKPVKDTGDKDVE